MIIGLGNPGTKYLETRHNVGFITIDEIAYRYNAVLKKKQFDAEIAELFIANEKVLLVKPVTFMNESGRSVGPLMRYYGVSEEEIVVIYDDMDLSVGKIRLREKGGAGGHNGMKSIIAHLGTKQFPRIKVGIDRPLGEKTVIQHVLGTFPKKDHPEILQSVKLAANAAVYFCENHTFVATMNQFNKK